MTLPTNNDTSSETVSSELEAVKLWLTERRNNALAIAERKHGDDKAGWLEDAEYLNSAISLLDRQSQRITKAEAEALLWLKRLHEANNRIVELEGMVRQCDGYDEAVNTVEEGFAELLAALGLPCDEGDGMDAAPAWTISQVLKGIAAGLAPLNIRRDPEDHVYKYVVNLHPTGTKEQV